MKPRSKEIPKICQKCGCGRRWLHRHHIVPKSKGGSDDAKNILQICANCHEDEHGGMFGGPLGGNRTAHTPEAKAKRSATMRAKWKDPKYRSKHLAALKRGLKKVDQSEKARKVRAAWTPQRRAAQAKRLSEIRSKHFWASRGPNADPDKPSLQRWSAEFKRCIICGTTKRKHRGRGLCITCYNRLHSASKHAKQAERRAALLKAKEVKVTF